MTAAATVFEMLEIQSMQTRLIVRDDFTADGLFLWIFHYSIKYADVLN
jgi:hypothetical protein